MYSVPHLKNGIFSIYIYSICKLILGKIANFPKIADTLTKFFHTEHNEDPFRRMRRLRTLHCGAVYGLFSAKKKDALKEKATDTFPSENGKQYKYPRPLMHLRLSICFYSDESKALENCPKRKTSCGSLQGSDSCRISISHEGLTKVL